MKNIQYTLIQPIGQRKSEEKWKILFMMNENEAKH